MKKKKIYMIVGLITGIIAIFMMFILPFFILDSIANKYAYYYLFLFLLMIGSGNFLLEKAEIKLTHKQLRKEKFKRLIKWI